MPRDFRALVELFGENREGVLYGELMESVHLVKMEPGRLTIRPEPGASSNLANRVGQMLTEWTGQRWVVAVTDRGGEPTLAEASRAKEREVEAELADHPLVQAVMAAFDGAKIVGWRDLHTPEPVDADTADLDDVDVRDALLYPQDEEGEF